MIRHAAWWRASVLAAAELVGIVGMLLTEGAGDRWFFALAAAPLLYGAIAFVVTQTPRRPP